MGYGSYSYEAHEAMTKARSDLPQQEVFRQRSCHPKMDPRNVKCRESRDSAAHPHSLSVVMALDVTGSMGNIPEILARQTFPSFMKDLMDAGIADPQVLFMAVGDAYMDDAPLQVGQFESSEQQLDQWLTWMFLERGGGSNPAETYELGMYFAAEHTAMDCFEKRGKKGYFFMTGDEPAFHYVAKEHVERLLGTRMTRDIPMEEVVSRLDKTFHPFFLIPDQRRRGRCEQFWVSYLGDRVIFMDDPADTCDVAAALVALTERAVPGVDAVAERLSASGKPKERVKAIVRAIEPWAKALRRAA
ncbi:VWA domain-containing protein [Pyxidicoccus fallax]|uniref:VWA domain-containing protein n=1 Tax=Pyxidicoccus fallax TaxID=394095 RepID=A0A848L8X0_9BACT|nr:VWA domain-containing protein [Pyxidicoccus fallax]NMO15440.1 VWA domain-containing protein [Pyxidicoccus fallax]NPC83176.1 VWA domain-containing protein [Pyxidicoccus fallax]